MVGTDREENAIDAEPEPEQEQEEEQEQEQEQQQEQGAGARYNGSNVALLTYAHIMLRDELLYLSMLRLGMIGKRPPTPCTAPAPYCTR